MSSDKSSALSTVEPVLAPLKAPAVVPTGVDLYARFAFSGAVCCGVTHGALTPVDVVKTRMQLDSATYNKGMIDSTRKIIRNEGVAALATGLGPTFAGYFLQGAFKFGGYEFWKKTMIDILGVETATANRTAVYLGSAAIAEFFADIALCPLEATRIRLVSQPNFASGLASGFARLLREEGVMRGFYSGFGPILFKQIPYTMAKFAVYEKTEVVYSVIQTPKSELAVSTNTAINLGSGLVAGLAAAVVSQPADTLLSKINKQKGTPGSVTSRLIKLAQELGPRGLFLGLGARLVMVGTLTAGQFAIYGDIKRILGATNSVELVRVTN
ncbi:9897_t:CDS:2 [Ambispora gerdemannii]|uniref:9897_t:CDS:1 n=1 Tax=Ambispora gerdemannii TaxID=144530 RepID=A0A9N9AE34_9GLOM|nr:9897_t:CDS:2 [Ambispora gerdemannii]